MDPVKANMSTLATQKLKADRQSVTCKVTGRVLGMVIGRVTGMVTGRCRWYKPDLLVDVQISVGTRVHGGCLFSVADNVVLFLSKFGMHHLVPQSKL